jgi:predicted aconitase/predicted aconitase with swiveling domain
MSAARLLVPGVADGPLLMAETGLSFWGGVDPATGLVIDPRHPLRGATVSGAVLAIPSGRGSCTASSVLLELIHAGRAPAALIFREEEQILTFGALAGDAIFGASLPVAQVPEAAFATLAGASRVRITGHAIETDHGVRIDLAPPPGRRIALSPRDEAMLAGREGEARRLAMGIILRLAETFGAPALIDVTRAHLDCCIHTGPASVAVAEKLRDLGGRFAVPTTLNAISTDLQRWGALGFDAHVAGESRRQTDAYLAMGAQPTFTCAPYLNDPPRGGEQIAWAESNAVAFANSVLGARTQKYPDYLDLCIALTGRAPLAGCHEAAGRRARTVLDVDMPAEHDDSFFPLLGYLAGLLSPHDIAAVTGLEGSEPTPDDLKAFAAAFATTSAAPMFHIVGVTPEAPTLDAAEGARRISVTRDDLAEAWRGLNPSPSAPVGLVAIGNPHASVDELTRLAALARGRRKADGVDCVVTTSRATLAAIEAAGVTAALRDFGVRIATDICWCMMGEPVAPPRQGAILTNSGKYAHYGPALTGGHFFFGSLATCVEAACSGVASPEAPRWLTPPAPATRPRSAP